MTAQQPQARLVRTPPSLCNSTWTGPDGLPFEPDEPAVTADRAARLADELAALVDQLIRVMIWQHGSLTLAGAGAPDSVRADRIADAQRVNVRARRTLRLLRDCLGEQHVECTELADQLRILLCSHVRATAGEVDR